MNFELKKEKEIVENTILRFETVNSTDTGIERNKLGLSWAKLKKS